MLTESCEKVANKFCCEICDYNTSRKSSYDKHLLTAKHSELTNVNKKLQKSCEKVANCQNFECETCNKEYKSRVGLWKHKSKCDLNNKKEKEIEIENQKLKPDIAPELLIKLVTELIKGQSGLQESMLEVIKNGTHNNNNNNTTNSHNKSFNLNFFLNETCKDAMNIMDFVDSIKLQLSDLEKVGEVGYVNGISNIIVKNLNELDVSKRPVHCTDKKRETLYVKDENKWEKDDEKKKLRKAIKRVATKNQRLLLKFKEEHPDCGYSASKYSDQYNKIIVESMGGSGDNDLEKEEKIIRNITKQVVIDKEN
jgi:hypothetical protein